MNEDELRERLRRIDPVPHEVAMEPASAPSALERLEHIMNTETITRPSAPDPVPPPAAGPMRRQWIAAAAVAVVAILGLVAFAVGRDDGSGTDAAGPPLELALGTGDGLASCLPMDVNILATMAPAFAATATAIDGDVITLEVDRWYSDGDAAEVRLTAMPGQAGLIAGFDFAVGEQYLITAAEGTVNFCGYSGPASPELTALFEQAFPA